MVVLVWQEYVEHETAILVWGAFGTDNHRLDDVDTSLVHPTVSQAYVYTYRRKMVECHATGRLVVRIANSLAMARERFGLDCYQYTPLRSRLLLWMPLIWLGIILIAQYVILHSPGSLLLQSSPGKHARTWSYRARADRHTGNAPCLPIVHLLSVKTI